ncbi:MAG: hypothetical protein FWG53_04665 [Clostridiales bacterium]|nr:hypothetical protein [Clostridiales bacterium]
MGSNSYNFENKFIVTAPANWSQKPGPDDHLVLGKSGYEVIVVRRESIRKSGQKNLDEHMNGMRENAIKFQHLNQVKMSSIEPFSTPAYGGRIMTYAFQLNGKMSEVTVFALQTEKYYYFLVLHAPADCQPETLNDYFDVVNSFRVIDEVEAVQFH